jgi:hypothetical protein
MKHAFIVLHAVKSWFRSFSQGPANITEAFHEFSSLEANSLLASYVQRRPLAHYFSWLLILVILLNFMTSVADIEQDRFNATLLILISRKEEIHAMVMNDLK